MYEWFQTCRNNMSRSVKMTSLDMSKRHANNTDRIILSKSEIYRIYLSYK